MRIRTVTAMMNLRPSAMDEQFEHASGFLHTAKEAFSDRGIIVQTLRISTQPYQAYLIDRGPEELIEQIDSVDRCAGRSGIDLVSIGYGSSPKYIGLAPSILSSTERISLSALISTRMDGVLEENIPAAAKTIRDISDLSSDGIKNFNFACLGNCPAGIPFFPASHQLGGSSSFSIGLESGEVAVSSLLRENDPRPSLDRIAGDYWKVCLRIQEVALELAGEFSYLGIDTSWNPSLSMRGSVARAVSFLGHCEFGSPGTLAACSAMTRIVKDVPVKRCGYTGLMLPVLEDLELVRAADEGKLSLQGLLAYSSVCGTGLDAVPLPGDVLDKELEHVLTDVAHLASRLDKPLSARLLPVPGAKEGDRTRFDSPYVANCKVVPIS